MWEIAIPKPTWAGFCIGNIAMFCVFVAIVIVGYKRDWWD